MENEIAVQQIGEVQAWSPREVMAQVTAIQQLMRQGMTENEHWGKIPGCGDKPALLKPGAEKLCLMFRLAPKFEIMDKDLGSGHKEIQVKCTLVHINTGRFWGEGVGSCSTMETKYRYRTGVGESTGVQVPKAFWDLRRMGKTAEAMEVLGGKGYTFKKGDDGLWWIHERIEKTENPDIADSYNTVLKIAKKRALVDATLTATAASDIFTQDIEENAPEPKSEVKPEEFISHSEQLELHKEAKAKNVPPALFKKVLSEKFGADGTAKIKKKDYPKIVEWLIQNEGDAVEAVAE